MKEPHPGMAGRQPRVFTIPSGAPFLAVLAREIVEGRLVEGFRPADDPLALASATIYLPTRRAAQALSAGFIDAMGGKAALLPVIRTLGDSDEDEFDIAASEAGEIDLPDAIGQTERQLVLARMVRSWTRAMTQETRELYGDEDIVIPSSAAEAVRLAGDLGAFLDSMETEEVDWDALPRLVREADSFDGGPSGRWAKWWNVTLEFLAIVSRTWPAHLHEIGRLDPSQRRRMLLDARVRRLKAAPPAGPVIVAGSTGSIPATARLIAAVARLEPGAVVLPGLDLSLPEPEWRRISLAEREDDSHSLCTHPQHGLARLLATLGVERRDVAALGSGGEARSSLLSAAMLPSSSTAQWARIGTNLDLAAATSGVSLVEAPNERLEALAIAIALREALEVPGRTAALVTPDRMLARRVSAELRRFNIVVADSGGTPLANTPAGRFARLVAGFASLRPDPVMLAMLLKHPLLAGQETEAAHRHARLFELALLRGAVVCPAPGALGEAAKTKSGGNDRHAPAEVRSMTPADWQAVAELGQRVDEALGVFAALNEGPASLQAWMAALRRAIEFLAESRIDLFRGMPGGAEAERLFDRFTLAGDDGFAVEAQEFADVLEALMAGENVRSRAIAHPRLAILGPLEARLQRADLTILGGLNEGVWPPAARNDPFLNRPMRAEIGLSLPERRIGQAAHDFQQLSSGAEIIHTRSLKSDNAPTVASRWLQRLHVAAGQEASLGMRQRGEKWLELAIALDRTEVRVARTPRPNPCPPVHLRPAALSVTQIETWIRDPYAIHARHILGLEPLPPLERDADPLMKGQVYHRILARFVTEPEEPDEMVRLTQIAAEALAEENLPPEVVAVWLPRFETIGRLFLEWEQRQRATAVRSAVETRGKAEVGATGFVLTGVADRIDLLQDGSVAIFDYKTGSGPSVRQARTLSPQLPLEGKIAQLGGFRDLQEQAVPATLAYVRLRAGTELAVDDICGGRDPVSPADVIENAWRNLEKLIAAYRRPEQGYLSRYAPVREAELGGVYDHLARVREWSTGAEEGGADE